MPGSPETGDRLLRLARTRQLVDHLGASLEPWPDLWPEGPEVAREAGAALLAALGAAPGEGEVRASQAHMALDEWLLSTDRERLTGLQCAALGCALLELFASSTVARDILSVLTALENIAPAALAMPRGALIVIWQVLGDLQQRAESVGLDEWEAALIIVARYCIGAVCGHPQNPASIEAAIDIMEEEASEDDAARHTLRRLAAEVQGWPGIDATVRAAVQRDCLRPLDQP